MLEPQSLHAACSSTGFNPDSDTAFEIVALATSAGGLHALSQILSELSADFPVAIVVVQHLAPDGPCLLPGILNQRSQLSVKVAKAGETLQAGTVYVAPPDRHLLLTLDKTLALTKNERVNFSRPAADVLFESISRSYQKRAIAVVLTGNGRDGASGIQTIKTMGGTTIAQSSAEFDGMPNAAIQTQAIDFVVPLEQIAATLVKLVNGR